MNKTIEDKLREGRSYRNIDATSFELRAENDEMRVRGYATTFNQPYELWSMDGYTLTEQVDPHAFDGAEMRDVIMQYDHEGRVFARVSNGTLTLHPDEIGLFIEARLDGTGIGRQLYEEIAGGYTTKMSFGFVVAEDKIETTEDKENNTVHVLRTITKISRLYDVSAVSLPANDATSISARSFGEGVIAEIREEFARRDIQRRKIKILAEINK